MFLSTYGLVSQSQSLREEEAKELVETFYERAINYDLSKQDYQLLTHTSVLTATGGRDSVPTAQVQPSIFRRF